MIKRERYSWIALGGLLLLYPAAVRWFVGLNDGTNGRSEPAAVASIKQIGTDAGRGNLLSVQPPGEPSDYRDGPTFREKRKAYWQTAPEYVQPLGRTGVDGAALTCLWL